jgi:hypothetical protein
MGLRAHATSVRGVESPLTVRPPCDLVGPDHQFLLQLPIGNLKIERASVWIITRIG